MYKNLRIHLLSFNFRVFGPPLRVQNDGGGEFIGEVKTFFEQVGIERIKGKPYYPQSQGKVERSHGTWKSKIRFDLLTQSSKFYTIIINF